MERRLERGAQPEWYAFRDPGEQWERPFYQAGTAVEQQIEGALRSAAEQGLIEDFDPEWVDFLRARLQIPAYVEHGLVRWPPPRATACRTPWPPACACRRR